MTSRDRTRLLVFLADVDDMLLENDVRIAQRATIIATNMEVRQ